MRVLAIIVAAIILAGCRVDATSLHADYDKSVADYRSCIAAKPASACEGLRAIMESNQRAFATTVRPVPAAPTKCTTEGPYWARTTTCF
jgi:hypothetical protein